MIINRVSRLLGDRRESVADLSRATGISYSTAYDLYRGVVTRIDFKTLDRLCEHFEVTPGEILEFAPAPSPSVVSAPVAGDTSSG
ncbi:MAG: helix-turn-helix transcriptional regulator [Chloroflexi bacterium]|nr:helix-turn-helix transcriptional regulator [Chloroflexota bacterium]